MILGCIGDDFTGSSDLANTLARGGMRTVQYTGVPDTDAGGHVEAGIVALKSRTIPAKEAVRQSLAAFEWLKAQGCRQYLFKYCSTFDSTDKGNIGPVAEALADALGARAVIVCPAFPAAGRSLYQGHLFVGDRLLSESGMEKHPLTPMTDPDIRRVLSRQATGEVGLIAHPVVAQGPQAIAGALEEHAGEGTRLIVVDAIAEADLMAIGAAAKDRKLISGGSGVALGLPANFAADGLLKQDKPDWQGIDGPAAVLAGSVSRATRAQVAYHQKQGHPCRAVTAEAVMDGTIDAQSLSAWALEAQNLPLIYSSADPQTVGAAQNRFGREAIADAIEKLFADTGKALVEGGVTRLVLAGGETSGAVVGALDVASMEIGPEIDPGVPALKVEGRELALALKSGNFGSEDFFRKAADRLGSGQ